jgi:hypothetical protein
VEVGKAMIYIAGPETEPESKVRAYLDKVFDYALTKNIEIATFSRPGTCEYVADTCKNKKIPYSVFRIKNMPYLANHDISEVFVSGYLFDILKELVDSNDIIVCLWDGSDTFPLLLSGAAGVKNAKTRIVKIDELKEE